MPDLPERTTSPSPTPASQRGGRGRGRSDGTRLTAVPKVAAAARQVPPTLEWHNDTLSPSPSPEKSSTEIVNGLETASRSQYTLFKTELAPCRPLPFITTLSSARLEVTDGERGVGWSQSPFKTTAHAHVLPHRDPQGLRARSASPPREIVTRYQRQSSETATLRLIETATPQLSETATPSPRPSGPSRCHDDDLGQHSILFRDTHNLGLARRETEPHPPRPRPPPDLTPPNSFAAGKNGHGHQRGCSPPSQHDRYPPPNHPIYTHVGFYPTPNSDRWSISDNREAPAAAVSYPSHCHALSHIAQDQMYHAHAHAHSPVAPTDTYEAPVPSQQHPSCPHAVTYPVMRPRLSIHPYSPPQPGTGHEPRYHSAGGAGRPGPTAPPSFSAHSDPAYSSSPSSAVSPNGGKGPRKRADQVQLQILNEVFLRTSYPSTEEREDLGRKLGMTSRSVQIWFQNRRRAVKVDAISARQLAEASMSMRAAETSMSAAEAQSHGLEGPRYLDEMGRSISLPPPCQHREGASGTDLGAVKNEKSSP